MSSSKYSHQLNNYVEALINSYTNLNDIDNMRKHSDYLKLKHDIGNIVEWILQRQSPTKKLLEKVTTTHETEEQRLT